MKLTSQKLILLAVILASLILVMCMSHSRRHVPGEASGLVGVFNEKFKQVIKNSDGKIDVRLDLSHRDGLYIVGDEPYVFVTVNKKAHVRLLYVTNLGTMIQKFPPPVYSDAIDDEHDDSVELSGFSSDYLGANVRYRIPRPGEKYKYVVELPEGVDRAQELVIAIACTAPFTSIDSLIMAKKERVEGQRASESSLLTGAADLGSILFPQEVLIMNLASKVFDLFSNIFIQRKSKYTIGYDYKVITIKQ
jgi:hypothetical protein